MVRIRAILALACWAIAPAWAADLTGLWQEYDGESGMPAAWIRISAQPDGSYAGVVERIFSAPGEADDPRCVRCAGPLFDRPILGMRIVRDMRRKPDGSYEGGEILDPEEGKTYRCRMVLSADGRSLRVTGYVGLPLFGRTERWTRQP